MISSSVSYDIKLNELLYAGVACVYITAWKEASTTYLRDMIVYMRDPPPIHVGLLPQHLESSRLSQQ